ncbi:MAG: Arginine-tRNA ligase [candidate division Zixibacteria bacterium RBG-1]|nr:MAG: Arginine-tRNA ligase [candidate division Zixibacteria bacterium RBG-1]OGC85283.1 MAG: arginine--tRNA ligase [candidate division Zixibacteria bacterium RBG_19FT_COMBO_42_43]
MNNPFVQEIVKVVSRKTDLPPQQVEQLLEIPPDEKLGDYAFPCFSLAKKFKKAPDKIAAELASQIKTGNLFSEIKSVGGYINFFVDKVKLAELVLGQILKQDSNYGSDAIGKGKTIPIDYSSPNIAKPFGIGHLRSTVIGHSLKLLFEKLSYSVVGINHLGDWGTQFGKLVVAYKKWGKEILKQDSVTELYNLYTKFHEEAEKNPALEEEARLEFQKLEKGDKENRELWEKFRKISLDEFKRIYKILEIEFEAYAGESFYENMIEQTVQELQEKKLTQISQDALVVNLDQFNLPPCLIKKKDESTLYATRDITAAIYRYKTYNFYKNLYVVGNSQRLHFQQVFTVVKLMGYNWADNCIHVDFGWVKFEEEILSSRKGNIILLEDVLDKSINLAGQIIEEKNPELENKKGVAEEVGIGAVVFAYLARRRNKDFDFVWEEVLNFEGETGPYLQYTHARLCSLQKKYEKKIEDRADFSLLKGKEEISLIKILEDFPRTIQRALDGYEPAVLSNYLVRLASTFNTYYQNIKIITEEEEKTRAKMLLVKSAQVVLKEGLRLLGLKAPEQM